MSRHQMVDGVLLDLLQRQRIRWTWSGACLIVQGDPDLNDAYMTQLPDDLTIEGSLQVGPPSRLRRLPRRLRVQGDLDVEASDCTEVPACLHVAGNIRLSQGRLSRLPEGLRVQGSLNVADNTLFFLPEGLDVAGDLNLRRNPMPRLPQTLRVGGTIYPPSSLGEIRTFLAGQSREVLGAAMSGHRRMHMRDRLRKFPDLCRIHASLPPGATLVLSWDPYGSPRIEIDPPEYTWPHP